MTTQVRSLISQKGFIVHT